MRRLVVVVALFLASTIQAQRLPSGRHVILGTYGSAAIAAADLASGPPAVFAFTNSARMPVISFRIVYADFVAVQPPIVPVSWHEFRVPTSADSWCAANRAHSTLSTPASCAAWWFDRYSSMTNIGEVSTLEKTVIVYWF